MRGVARGKRAKTGLKDLLFVASGLMRSCMAKMSRRSPPAILKSPIVMPRILKIHFPTRRKAIAMIKPVRVALFTILTRSLWLISDVSAKKIGKIAITFTAKKRGRKGRRKVLSISDHFIGFAAYSKVRLALFWNYPKK